MTGYQDAVLPDDEFDMVLARARNFRRRVDELGDVSGSAIDGYVRDRLRYRANGGSLPPAQAELADEILAVLQLRTLSLSQADLLEREFFTA